MSDFEKWWSESHANDENEAAKKLARRAWQAARSVGDGEAVGEITCDDPDFYYGEGRYVLRAEFRKWLDSGTKLYTHPPAAKVPEGLAKHIRKMMDLHEKRGVVLSVHMQELEELLSATPQPEAGAGQWVRCHMETAGIALEALEFYAAERFKGFGDDPEPLEHHLAQKAIQELQDLVPQTPQENTRD